MATYRVIVLETAGEQPRPRRREFSVTADDYGTALLRADERAREQHHFHEPAINVTHRSPD